MQLSGCFLTGEQLADNGVCILAAVKSSSFFPPQILDVESTLFRHPDVGPGKEINSYFFGLGTAYPGL